MQDYWTAGADRLVALSRRGAAPEFRRPHDQQDAALGQLHGAEIGQNDFGEHLFVSQWYSTPEPSMVCPDVLRLLFPVASVVEPIVVNNPANWLFLDIETTGITKGAGTYAFLVGMAWWESQGLQIEQLFMRAEDEEHSVLLKVAQRLKQRPVLVTFNGKSCDWRLLEMRFRMTRGIDVPDLAMHLDFLHPTRDLWRLRFPSLRLADLERCVLNAESLGWSREHDIEPTHIPAIYFDYLRGGPTEPLGGVFLHNCMDLRGLAALAGHISKTITAADTVGPNEDVNFELYGIARMLARRGDITRARAAYERAIRSGLPVATDQKARYELARLARRQKDFDRAAELWRKLSQGTGPNSEAWEQLAIHYERRTGNHPEAARATRSGIAKLQDAARPGSHESSRHEHLLERFQRRLARLEGKLRKE